jgi:hypothetical protein
MLPLGSLRPSAGWGEPRETRLTRDEQRSLMTLWCIFRSPLIMGGNLLALDHDPWTRSLLTNPEVLAVNQHSKESGAVIHTGKEAVWLSRPERGGGYYLAAFNLGDEPQTLTHRWPELGLSVGRVRVRDLWERRDLPPADSLRVSLPAHGSALLKVGP